MLRRNLLALLLILACSLAHSETLFAEGKILRIRGREVALEVDGKPLVVRAWDRGKWWSGKSACKLGDFKEGDLVFARIKTDADPPVLREMADASSWQWLETVRAGVRAGVVERLDNGYLIVKLDDGTTFRYRVTAKTDLSITGVKGLRDLKKGMNVHVQGRTMSNLDTWAVAISDQPIGVKPGSNGPSKSAELKPLPVSGRITGKTVEIFEKLSMFDIQTSDRKLHVTFEEKTKWFVDGSIAKSSAFSPDLDCIVTYQRDKAGRIIATKIELFHPKNNNEE